MQGLAGGTIEAGFADAYPHKPETKVVELTAGEVERILGMALDTAQILSILDSLEFTCQVEGEIIRATVPYYRLDVSIPADLIEEVARVYGYDKLPTTLMEDELPPQERDFSLEGEERIRDILVGCGLTEAITYSLSNLESFAKLEPDGAELDPRDYIRLSNPLTTDREYMRRTLMASLLEAVRDNLRYTEQVALFEIGRVYLPQPGEELPDEPRRLAMVLTGPRDSRSWLTEGQGYVDFYDLKGVVETLLDHLGLSDRSFAPVKHPTFRPGGAATLKLGAVEIGVLGEVHPEVRESFDLPAQPVALLELDLEELLAQVDPIRYRQPISRFPAVTQDMSLAVDEDVPAQQVEDLIRRAGGELLAEVTLFDVYRGDPIPPGKKSVAYCLTYRHAERTLTDKEVAKVHAKIAKQLSRELGAELRQ
jgi:phenylalanyl-tRNA synthetase beta chain